jgi:hypothetical protein
MIRGDDLDVTKAMKASPQLTDGHRGAEQVLGGHRTEAADELRLNDFQLLEQEATAVRGLCWLGIPIAWRAAFQDVQNINVLTPQRASFDDLVEQLPSAADKRFSLPIFVRSGGLTQKHEAGH